MVPSVPKFGILVILPTFSFHALAVIGKAVQTSDEEWRHTVLLEITLQSPDKKHYKTNDCTGVFWRERGVLTDAHCATHRNRSGSEDRWNIYQVRVARFKASDEVESLSQFYFADDPRIGVKMAVHPQYAGRSATDFHDVAVFAFTRQLTDDVYSAPLIAPLDKSQTRVRMVGSSDWNHHAGDPLLQRSDSAVSQILKSGPNSILVSSSGDKVCGGDSGGPVFVIVEHTPILVGLMTAIDDPNHDYCSTKGGHSYSLLLESHFEWIDSQYLAMLKSF